MIYLFPVWALTFVLIAYVWPQAFNSYQAWIVPLLMLVMLGMGFTLRWHDFAEVWQLKKVVGIGVLIQFGLMPFAAWVLAMLLGLSDALTIGMMLVGATAGGTASNVITYLAKGHVALSVSMTLVSTLLAVVSLPLLTWLYIGQSVDVPITGMMTTLFKLIVLPVAAGMILRHLLGARIDWALRLFPLISMAAIVLIIAIVVAFNQNQLGSVAALVVLAVVLHNLIGLVGGYGLSRVLGYDSVIARTVAIEVGMQNSGLSVALALKYYGAISALPGVVFSIWHNVSGALFASFWQARERKSPGA